MRRCFPIRISLMLLALACVGLPLAAHAANVSKTAMAGPYSVTLKVLPAEAFAGPQAEMVRDGGAQPNHVNGPAHPNHHMVVFLKQNGKPVEHAHVTIRYKSSAQSHWKTLPVVQMHVKGKGAATTHFGNNLMLAPGSYEVQVRVDGKGPATFHFSI